MNINFENTQKSDIYKLLTSTVLPRPVAWVLTENENGRYNIAPFSYFTIVSSDPAILMIAVGHKRDGSQKDTWKNIAARRRSVIHIANDTLMEDVNESARALAEGETELDLLSVTLNHDKAFSLPRISECPVAFDCDYYDIHEVGNGPQAAIYVEVKSAYIDDSLSVTDFTVPEKELNAIARLGGDRYSLIGDIKSIPRPS